MIWSPLGGGRLFGPQAAEQLSSVLGQVADFHGVSVATVVFAWIMQLPSKPIPLTGSGRIEAIKDAMAATRLKLSRSEWFSILRAARGHEVA